MKDALLNNLKPTVFCLIFSLLGFNLLAQTPIFKVDLNIADRKEDEVNEPDFIPWPIKGGPESRTFEGIEITFKNGSVASSWYKAGVQAPNYARLVSDGIKTSEVEMHISGLQIGKHSLVTYLNTTDNPDTNVFSPIDIYVNNVLTINNLELSNRVKSNDDATIAYVEFEVKNSDPTIIRFKAAPLASSTNEYFLIGGFHLNSSDPNRMSRFQYPGDKDEHVDIDADSLVFSWRSPANTVSHNIYFGTDYSELLLADKNSPLFIKNTTDTSFIRKGFYNIDSYYWRVDPIDSNGDTTKGAVWYFKKRIPAFPGAEGYGGYALGGRGGKVVYVTNLNDEGPGSFRYAVENETGPRTILFAVSGIITQNSRLVIRDNYITIAGQSAPGKGICFRWAPIGVTGDNLIVQNIRMRLGIGVTFDGMGLTGAEYSIIDHCSISWTIDEAFSSRGAKNITLQRTLISEALNQADHQNYGSSSKHGFAASIGGDIGSFHHNLLAHCAGRNWSLAGGLDGDGYYAGRLDISNNIVYNYGYRATDGGAHEVNFVGNYYKKGAATSINTILKAQLEGLGKGSQSYFFNGNIVANKDGSLVCDGTDNSCARTYSLSKKQVLDWDVWRDKEFFPPEATIHNAKDAYKLVLSDVGCTQPVFDNHDYRVIGEALNGTTSLKGSKTNLPGLPDHELDAGGWEAYPGYLRDVNWDTDLDGLPNWWEKVNGLDTNSAAGFIETNADNDKNGYTNLEEYLHWMDKPHYFMNNEDSIKIEVSEYTRGFTDSPTFEITNAINGAAKLKTDNSVIFTPSSKGLAELEFKVSDAEGSSLTQKIGIYYGKMISDSMFTYSYYLDREKTKIVTVDSVNTITLAPVIEDTTSSIDNYNSSVLDLIVYPNPANNQLNVNFKSNITLESEFQIYDIAGQSLYSNNYSIKQGQNLFNLDISTLSPGIYTLNLGNSDTGKSVRFIKN